MKHLKEHLKGKKISKIILIRGIVLLVLLSGAGYYYFTSHDSAYRGTIETTVFPVITEVSGVLLESPVNLGETVKKGDVIALIDDTTQQYALEQLNLSLEKRQLSLQEATLAAGGQASNAYLSAKASYDSASAAVAKAREDLADAQTLYDEGALSENELAKIRLGYTQAASMQSSTLSQLNNSLNASNETSIQIELKLLESQIRQAQENLEKFKITAPCDGTVISKNYNQGSFVASGYNLADIGSSEEMYVVFYVPEDQIGTINYGDKVTISYEGEQISGKISYIDLRTQYTPKDLQTEANKSKTSFKVKALLPENAAIKPGLEVKVNL